MLLLDLKWTAHWPPDIGERAAVYWKTPQGCWAVRVVFRTINGTYRTHNSHEMDAAEFQRWLIYSGCVAEPTP